MDQVVVVQGLPELVVLLYDLVAEPDKPKFQVRVSRYDILRANQHPFSNSLNPTFMIFSVIHGDLVSGLC